MSHEGRTEIVLWPGKTPEDSQFGVVRHTEKGTIRQIQTRMRMNPDKGETFTMNVKRGKDWTKQHILTAAGYLRLNTIVGVSFNTPETVLDDNNDPRPNPWLERHTDGIGIRRVRVRQIGIGRAMTGAFQVYDLTVVYDLETYLAQDLWSRWTGRSNDQPKEWGVVLPEGETLGDKPGTWKPYAIPGMQVNLWLHLNNKEVLSLIGEHINRQKFAERNAVTICQRNILRRFIAASKLDDSLSVPVVGWVQTEKSFQEFKDIAQQAATSGKIQIGDQFVDVESGKELVQDAEEIDTALAGEADEDMVIDAEHTEPGAAERAAEPPAKKTPPPTEPVNSQGSVPKAADGKQRLELAKEIDRYCQALGDKAFAILGTHGIADHGELAGAGIPVLVELRDALKQAVSAQPTNQQGSLLGNNTDWAKH